MFLCRNSTNHQMIVIRLSIALVFGRWFFISNASSVGNHPRAIIKSTNEKHGHSERDRQRKKEEKSRRSCSCMPQQEWFKESCAVVITHQRRKRSIIAIAIAYDFQSTKTFVFSIADNKLQHTKTFWRNAGGTNATIAQRLALHAGINNECRRHKRNNSTEIGFELQETTTNDFDTGSAWRTRQ